jgi:outer membrane biosynthesis protein TonB
MKERRHFILLALLLSLATSGCDWFHRKKPNVPQQAQAPTITQPAPAPAPPPTTAQQQPPAQPQPGPSKPVDENATKPKPKPTHPVAKRVVPPPPKPVEQAAAAPPPRIVIQEGGADASTPQVSTAPHNASTDQQRTTQQLLDATDNNLRGLTRTLTPDEKAMVEQIRAYMSQSRDATKDGDVIRAHNLALKAHLLSDELIKQ